MWVDLVHTIETGGRWAGNQQVALRGERQVICRNAGLNRRKDKNLAILADFKNRATTISDVEVFLAIKGNPGRDSHAFGISRHGSVGGNPIYGAVEARRYIHLAGSIESDGGGIRHLGQEGLDVVSRINFENGYRNLLPTRS